MELESIQKKTRCSKKKKNNNNNNNNNTYIRMSFQISWLEIIAQDYYIWLVISWLEIIAQDYYI